MATINTDPRIVAMLDLVAWSEGTQLHPLTKCNGYDVIVTGDDGMHTFTDFSTHRQLGRTLIRDYIHTTGQRGADRPKRY